jgi:hypothetical protein
MRGLRSCGLQRYKNFMRLEVETTHDAGRELPFAFRLRGRCIAVVDIIDQWFGPDYRYCKLKGDDGAVYILRVVEHRSDCGNGVGAARVIEDTVSPDKRFAFAWRDPEVVPDTMPEGFTDMEFLLARLSDGAVLAKDQTEYWDTGEGHANGRQERAVWSPDGALAVRIYDTRFETSALQVYAPESNDDKAAVLDLKKIVEPAPRRKAGGGS